MDVRFVISLPHHKQCHRIIAWEVMIKWEHKHNPIFAHCMSQSRFQYLELTPQV